MAKKKISAINLDKAVSEVLSQYGEEVYKVLDKSVEEVASKASEKLKGVTRWKNSKPGSAYSASWTNESFRVGRLGVKRVVYNEGHSRLTHLLEKGHVSRNGTGRTFGKVPAYPHIAPVNDWVVDELAKIVERNLNA